MKNRQVLIKSLPEGKLVESNYELVESEMLEIDQNEILVKTISFAITAGTRAGLQGSASSAPDIVVGHSSYEIGRAHV